MTLSQDEIAKLRRLEEDLWIAETRFDYDYMDQIFADDFTEIGRSGRVYTREELLFHEGNYIDAVLPLPNFSARLLTNDVAQVTYNSAVTYDGIVEHGRRSSIWSRKGDSWELRFHQGTPYNV